MPCNPHFRVSDSRQKWVDDLLAQIQEQNDREEEDEDSRSSASDFEGPSGDQTQLEDTLVRHLDELRHESLSNNQGAPRARLGLQALQNEGGRSPLSKLNEQQERLKNGQENLESRYKNIEGLFERLVTLNAARQEEQNKHLDFFDSLTSDFDTFKIQYQLICTEYLEEACHQYLKTGHFRFLNEIPAKFREANVLFDCQIVQDLQMNDRLRVPHAALGFHVIYALHPLEYEQHIEYAPEEVIQIINLRAELDHLGRYKNVAEKEQLSSIKAKCYKIISLWMNHVTSIHEYPDDGDEAKAAQLENYPADKINAEIDELYEMRKIWEKKEAMLRDIMPREHGLLMYQHSRGGEQGFLTMLLLRHPRLVMATVISIICLLL
ncbi:hypothetical protein TMatcc_005164 [Talaromyces marneffei ATCC 18224]|uniref:uncharacterized protein n=1 Tax=Talaromyces marneffei TaxID=37727 RepID=UPI0012A8A8DA|nr:uncharacterized protein EYB26_006265 [Talaromyces marneffei]KAE8555240.1 hypothetical protein EYB25_003788 [Talaromyces marneffei]QGA18580.1 hypothetical protein EYB26_006265 [Talaromyces marneffei]